MMDPFEEAAMAEAGMPAGGDPLMLPPGGGDPLMLPEPSTVVCQVCGTAVDAVSGAPTGPVSHDAAAAAQQFVAADGAALDAEIGGIQLI